MRGCCGIALSVALACDVMGCARPQPSRTAVAPPHGGEEVAGISSSRQTPASSDEPAAATSVQSDAIPPSDLEASKTIAPEPWRTAPPDDVAAPPPDARKTLSGLAHRIIVPGHGTEHARPWDRVIVRYAGWTTDGELFDSSTVRAFELPNVIPGWSEAVQLMVVGERRRLWIPEALAFKGRPGTPQGTLVFDIELISIKRLTEAPSVPMDVAAPPRTSKRTKSGLADRVLTKGTGTTHPTSDSRVSVHYAGWTTEGRLFDSSIPRGVPFTIVLSEFLPGWTEGIQLMVEGERTRFWLPEKLTYQGRPNAPKGILVYDIELLSIEPY